jgi:UDP-N-acetylglucosamine 2-epimerase (non-hydrolysing)
MKIMTILGTRPEIIRLSLIIPKLDARCARHVLVHTGQNYDAVLKDSFFREMGVRAPDRTLNARGSFGLQLAALLPAVESLITREQPDRLLILGDTNSGLSALVAKRMGIPVYHMEAGNRCYDDRVPEEVNRRVIDHSSDVLMPYTERSRQNLLREGIPGERILVTGNPIREVMRHYDAQIASSDILAKLEVAENEYLLVTMHRAENVDIRPRLASLVRAIELLQRKVGRPVIVSTHPRTRSRMKAAGLAARKRGVRFLPPFGFFDFVKLERHALCVLSDSGTVQEECCILGVPNVTLRDTTERPETLECGSNILSGVQPESVVRCVAMVLDSDRRWKVPPEYLAEDVSARVMNIVTGYRDPA